VPKTSDVKKLETLFLLLIAVNLFSCQESIGQITGSVNGADQQPLPQVNIVIKGSDRGTQTDEEGKYNIIANRGDTLLFSHIGMHPVEILVKRRTSVINVRMIAASIEIEEVEIKTKAKVETRYKSQKELLKEFPTNKNLIKTSWRIIDKDLSSTYMRIIDGNDLVPAGRDFLTSLQDHVPHMRVVRELGGVSVSLGHTSFKNNPPAIFDVDGIIQGPPTYLSANEIDRIAVLGMNAGIAKYGPQGAGGVIVVNTKAQTWMDDMGVDRSDEHRKFIDSLVQVTHFETYLPYEPPYIKKLNKARTEKKILAVYENQKESYFNDPYYFLEVYDLFLSRWGNINISKELFLDVRNRLPDDVPVLKALAYLQQQYGNYESALNLYIQILLMQSWDAQALRDVANAYAEAGDVTKAWMYYTQYIDIQNQLPNAHFDAYGEDQLITTEMMDILDVYEDPFLNIQDIENILDDDMRTRLVFEWNNQEAEFELQFVTPEGFYDTWEHKPGRDALQDLEAVKGYFSNQFFLGMENKGLWQVNIDYKGNQSEVPTYLKVSVYRDYGLPSQQIEIKIYKLSKDHEKVQLFTFQQS
jgi:tetratricopeptide (TPR) repeat protein